MMMMMFKEKFEMKWKLLFVVLLFQIKHIYREKNEYEMNKKPKERLAGWLTYWLTGWLTFSYQNQHLLLLPFEIIKY